MFLLLCSHLVAATIALTGFRRRPVVGAAIGLAVFAATAVTTVVLGVGVDAPRVEQWAWVDQLGLMMSLRLDGFAVLMTLLVSVLGFGVLAYSVAYFDHDDTYRRFVGLFIAFAGAMTGLVLSADLFTMFVFWELTSVCSFLLIGLNDKSATARASALRALLVTGAGGLCLLAGVGVFQVVAGTSSFAELAAAPPSGTAITVAVVLVLMGAFTKSAQFPFHFWLPGAMAAPTPVSAYLHSATMVKAGIVLMARMAPIFGEVDVWRWLVVVCGGITMLLGGIRALRQTDAKLLLAHSTVSQLGFLTILVGMGVPGATYAGVAHLLAHAVFKAGLFLGVGVVDHETGTRDIRELRGVGRQMPVVAGLFALAAASMAGLIPLFGFATKEKALVALLHADEDVGAVGTVALVFVVLGAVLSAAYSVRLVVGMFGDKGGGTPTHVHHRPGALLVAPVAASAVASLLAGLAAGVVGGWLVAPAASLDPVASGKLALWPGINTALLISLAVLAIGAVVGWKVPLDTGSWRLPLSGERAYQFMLDGLLDGSRRVTAVSQSGSLLVYLVVVSAVVAAAMLAGIVLDPGAGLDELVLADSVTQAVVVVLAIGCAFAVVLTRYRFMSALLLGGVGFGCAVIFALYGAPDLALTQLLVETLTIVVFLLALRQMPSRFEPAPSWAPRVLRIGVAAAVGVTAALFMVMVSAARTAPSSGEVYAQLSEPEAGGRNIVNVILVDFRGWDTMGEITVLAVAALGVVNLVRMAHRAGRRPSADEVAS
jgi:multicomponent Na+:H+ antiporter subunit A